MEGKIVILSVLIMSLVMAQIQVDAKICCPSKQAQNAYRVCRLGVGNQQTCLSISGCKKVDGNCPSGYISDTLQKSDVTQGDAVNEYCKLGCAYSVCGAMNSLQSFDANEIVSEAVAQCAKACSTFCTKDSSTVVETA